MVQWKCSSFSVLLFLAAIATGPATAMSIDADQAMLMHQVAIRVRQEVLNKTEDYHLCNGLIVDPSYVVTTAKCANLGAWPSNDSELYIAAGHLSNDDVNLQLNFTIVEIIIHDRYLQGHDIALLKIDGHLPMSSVVKIPHVQDSQPNTNCSVIIRNENSANYFQLVPELILTNNLNACVSRIPVQIDEEEDGYYCSQYPLSVGWCSITKEQLQSSPDLGAALICNSVFMGVLSDIQFTDDTMTFPCNKPRTALALYTSLDEHEDWMSKVMGRKPSIPVDPDDKPDSAQQLSAATMMVVVGTLICQLFL